MRRKIACSLSEVWVGGSVHHASLHEYHNLFVIKNVHVIIQKSEELYSLYTR